MAKRTVDNGFTLIELLIVLAILAILATVAIHSLLNARRTARLQGDAKANAQILAMALETKRADTGIYGSAGATCTWTASGAATNSTLLPSFTPKGQSQMVYVLDLPATPASQAGFIYVITVKDPLKGNAVIWKVNQNGSHVS